MWFQFKGENEGRLSITNNIALQFSKENKGSINAMYRNGSEMALYMKASSNY